MGLSPGLLRVSPKRQLSAAHAVNSQARSSSPLCLASQGAGSPEDRGTPWFHVPARHPQPVTPLPTAPAPLHPDVGKALLREGVGLGFCPAVNRVPLKFMSTQTLRV